MTDTTTPPWWESDVTDSEPAPALHTAGSDSEDGQEAGPTRTRARVRAKALSVPRPPALIRTLFVGDAAYPFRETWPRLSQRVDYALHGDYCAPENWKLRYLYTAITVLIACPIAAVIDLLDWCAFPLGRLAISIALVWLLATNL